MDNNIDDRVLGRNNLLWPSNPKALTLWPERALLLLSCLFDNSTKAISSKSNNSSRLSSENLSPKLPLSIISHDSSNSLLNSNDCKL